MPILNSVAPLLKEITAWRHDFHMHPELLYEVHRTAGIVADKLKEFGCDEVAAGIGRTGVVGIIKGRKPGKVIGLRADMDALPILEASHVPYQSKTEGRMHACGHDGHTAMLLGAAKLLCDQRNFDGTVAVIFQPAEEGGAGAQAMIDDGLITRFGIQEFYGMHNMPKLPVNAFAIQEGVIMASADQFDITLKGVGGHAAKPHQTIDPIVAGAQIVTALQTIASRNMDPLQPIVVTITQFQSGTHEAHNIIPDSAVIRGTVRTLSEEARVKAFKRLTEIVEYTSRAMGIEPDIQIEYGYPVTENTPLHAQIMAKAAEDIVGEQAVLKNVPPSMGSEDFSYMLKAAKGAMILLGQGNTPGLHHPEYDFNDALLPVGVSFWVKLVDYAMKK